MKFGKSLGSIYQDFTKSNNVKKGNTPKLVRKSFFLNIFFMSRVKSKHVHNIFWNFRRKKTKNIIRIQKIIFKRKTQKHYERISRHDWPILNGYAYSIIQKILL